MSNGRKLKTRAHRGQFPLARCCCSEVYFNARSTRQKALVPAFHSDGTSPSPPSLLAHAGPALPHPAVLKGSYCRERPEVQEWRSWAPGTDPMRRVRAGVAGSSLWHFLRSPPWNSPRFYLFILNCEQKTNRKMSKITQAWHFTVAETIKMN